MTPTVRAVSCRCDGQCLTRRLSRACAVGNLSLVDMPGADESPLSWFFDEVMSASVSCDVNDNLSLRCAQLWNKMHEFHVLQRVIVTLQPSQAANASNHKLLKILRVGTRPGAVVLFGNRLDAYAKDVKFAMAPALRAELGDAAIEQRAAEQYHTDLCSAFHRPFNIPTECIKASWATTGHWR